MHCVYVHTSRISSLLRMVWQMDWTDKFLPLLQAANRSTTLSSSSKRGSSSTDSLATWNLTKANHTWVKLCHAKACVEPGRIQWTLKAPKAQEASWLHGDLINHDTALFNSTLTERMHCLKYSVMVKPISASYYQCKSEIIQSFNTAFVQMPISVLLFTSVVIT